MTPSDARASDALEVARARLWFWSHAPLLPLAALLGAKARRRMPMLPEAAGPRGGLVGAAEGAPCPPPHPRAEAPFDLAVIGESTAAGVGVERQDDALGFALARAMQRRRGGAVRLQVAGQSGATVERVHALALALAFPVDVAVVLIGVNDVLELTRGRRWAEQVGALIRDLHGRDAREILVSGIPPLGSFATLPLPTRSALGARARYLDALLRRTCAAHGARYVPLALPSRAEYLARDGFHPSAAGYAAWAATLAAASAE